MFRDWEYFFNRRLYCRIRYLSLESIDSYINTFTEIAGNGQFAVQPRNGLQFDTEHPKMGTKLTCIDSAWVLMGIADEFNIA